MRKENLAEVRPIYDQLLAEGQYSEALRLLEKVCPSHEDSKDWAAFLDILTLIPEDFRCKSSAALLYAKTLRLNWALKELLNWNDRVVACQGLVMSAPVQVEAAGALNGLQRYAEARDTLYTAIPHVFGESLGIAWSRLGYALFHLGEPMEVWHKAFASAHPLLKNEELGRALLNEGYCLSMSGQPKDAYQVWLEALTYFKRNPYFLAWIRYNLATIALNNFDPEAERHLLKALEQVHHPKAEGLSAAIWNGLGRFRSQVGEWSRAEFAYLEALKKNGNAYDKETAYRGLIRVQYLSGQFNKALETLETALHEPDLSLSLLNILQAKVYLRLDQPIWAKAALEKAGIPQHELEQWPWRIAKAELARQEGRPEVAIALLEGLPLHTLHAREEVRQWPKLFELVKQAGKEIPLPLEYPDQTTVEVKALGLLEVKINGRKVELHPLNRTGELLVFLLENGGEASSEHLVDALWEGASLKEKRKRLVELVSDLRHVLGWPASVGALRKAYQLDPDTLWVYDVDQARANKKVKGNFLEGIYSNWAREVDEELGAYREAK